MSGWTKGVLLTARIDISINYRRSEMVSQVTHKISLCKIEGACSIHQMEESRLLLLEGSAQEQQAQELDGGQRLALIKHSHT